MVSFTNSLNYTRVFTELELNNILLDLNSASVYFTNGLNSLAYIRLNIGNLLLLDLNDNINRKLFELFNFTYDIANPFSLKLIHNDSALEYKY